MRAHCKSDTLCARPRQSLVLATAPPRLRKPRRGRQVARNSTPRSALIRGLGACHHCCVARPQPTLVSLRVSRGVSARRAFRSTAPLGFAGTEQPLQARFSEAWRRLRWHRASRLPNEKAPGDASHSGPKRSLRLPSPWISLGGLHLCRARLRFTRSCSCLGSAPNPARREGRGLLARGVRAHPRASGC